MTNTERLAEALRWWTDDDDVVDFGEWVNEGIQIARAALTAADAVGGEAHTAADVLRYAKGDEALTSWLGRTLVHAVVDEGSWDHLKLQLEAIAWDQKLNLEDALATVDEFVRDYACPQCQPAPAAPAVPDGYALVPVEPTEDMLFAAELSKPRGYRDLWAAMLASVPAAPAPEAQDSARTSPAHQPVHGWTDADADAARLALELECLLTDRDMPTATVSRWWDSAHEALRLHRQRLASEQAHGIGATTGEQHG